MKKSICETSANGTKFWYRDGKCHREDGPAIEYANGDKSWYRDGKRHREDGPAIEYANGNKWWYQDDVLHREDGPAIEYCTGNKKWYYRGFRIECFSQKEFQRITKLKAFW